MSLLKTIAQFDNSSTDFSPEGMDDFYTWLEAVEQISPEPDMDVSTAGGISFWRKKFDKGLTPEQAIDEAFPDESLDVNDEIPLPSERDMPPAEVVNTGRLTKDMADFRTWMREVEDWDPAAPQAVSHIKGFWRAKYNEGLTVEQAISRAWDEDQSDWVNDANPVLAALSKFDKRADYKVKPFINPSDKPSKELSNYQDAEYPRADSKSIDDIAHLYNVRHECYEYKDNIMEAAHPDMLVLLPAYDKMNGLIENEMERQKINLNILKKPVQGLEYRQKYAELIKTLIRTANDMDFQNQERLYTLADKTITQLQKEALDFEDIGRWLSDKTQSAGEIAGGATSGAELGSIAGGLIGAFTGSALPGGSLAGAWAGGKLGGLAGAALGGVISAIFKTAPIAKSVQQNAHTAKDKIDALIKDHPGDLFLTELDTALLHIQDTASTYSKLTSQMQSSHVGEDQVMKLGQQYIQEIQNLDNLIDVFIANAKSGKYASDEADWVAKIKSPIRGLIGDPLHDAVQSVEVLEQVSHQAMDSIQHVKETASSLPDELEELQKALFQTKK